MAQASGRTTLVASSLPPRPTSTTIADTPASAKARKPIKVASSKNVSPSPSSAPAGPPARAQGTRRRIAPSSAAARSSEMGAPSMRMRSQKCTRWGEV